VDKLLTLKEMANRLGVPESNLRYYRNRIGDFLPSVGKGRKRRYFSDAEEIFKRTIDYISDGISLDRIYAIFAENKPLALKEEIARPAQEELAEIIIEKFISAKDALFQDVRHNSNGATVLEMQEIKADLSEIKRMIKQHFSSDSLLSTQDSLDDQLLDLRQQLDTLSQANEELNQQLFEKDRIMEGQKKALLDARDKRQQLMDELARLKENVG
jgi:DNA-binding transcriptional MerR regulator